MAPPHGVWEDDLPFSEDMLGVYDPLPGSRLRFLFHLICFQFFLAVGDIKPSSRKIGGKGWKGSMKS